MATQQTIMVDGKPYVLLPRAEYDRLNTLAKVADLPPLPEPDEHGNYPALEYSRASLARKIILRRVAIGWTQRELADRAGVSVGNLCRIETGKHAPVVSTVDKIDRALQQAEKRKAKKSNKK